MKTKNEKNSKQTAGLKEFWTKLKAAFSGWVAKLSEKLKISKKAVVIILSSLAAVVAAAIALVIILSGKPAAPEETQPPVNEPVAATLPGVDEWFPYASAELKAAYEAHEGVIGWLTVDGCEIDDMVFQGTDNDYYLRKNNDGEYDVWGCYFLDYINIIDGYDFFDKTTIIYGHSLDDLPDDEKFSKLKRYKDDEFAAAHPTISLSQLYREHTYEIFAACNIPITIDYIDPNPEEEKYQSILDYMVNNSYYDFGVPITTNDQILVLSTCTSDENVRFVVAAKLAQ